MTYHWEYVDAIKEYVPCVLTKRTFKELDKTNVSVTRSPTKPKTRLKDESDRFWGGPTARTIALLIAFDPQ